MIVNVCTIKPGWWVGPKTNGPFPQTTEKQESLKTKSSPNAEQGKCKKSHQTFRERRQVLYKGTEFAREHVRTAGPSLEALQLPPDGEEQALEGEQMANRCRGRQTGVADRCRAPPPPPAVPAGFQWPRPQGPAARLRSPGQLVPLVLARVSDDVNPAPPRLQTRGSSKR